MMNSKKKSRPNTSNPKSVRKEEEKTVVPDGVYLNSRFMHTITSLIGNTVQLHLSNGKIVEGIFTTFSPQFAIVLEMAHHVDPSQPGQIRVETVEERLVCPSQNVITMTSQDVELDYASRDAFAIDTAISSRFNGQRAGEKELEPWEADSNDGVDINLDSETNGWDADDMFERNERIYGVTTTFDCSLSQYTTKLEHKDTQDYKELEARAAKIANIIDSNAQSRAAAELENSEDEEEKFSAVVRNSSGQQQHQQPSHSYSKSDSSSPSYSSPSSSSHGPSSLQQPGPGKYVPPAKRKNPQMGKLTRGNTPSPRQGAYYDENAGKHGQTSYSQNQGPNPGYYQGSNRSNASPTSYGHAHGHGMPPHGPKNMPSQDARLNGDERRNELKSNEPPRGRDSHYDRHGSENRVLSKQDGSSSHGDSNQPGPPARNLDNRKPGPAHKSRDDQASELKKFGHDFRLGEAPQQPVSHHQAPPPQQQQQHQQQQIQPPPHSQLPPVANASQQEEKRRPSPAPVTTPIAAAPVAAPVPNSSKTCSNHGAPPPTSAVSPVSAMPSAPAQAANSPEGKMTPATTPTSNQTTPTPTSAASTPSQEKPDEDTEKLTLTLKKSSLNPNAKEFILNPNAKAFTPRSPSTPTPPRSHTPQTGPVPMGPGSLPGPGVGQVPQQLPMMPALMVPSYMAAAAAAAAQGQGTPQGTMNPGQPGGGHMQGATPSPGQPPYGPTPNQNPRFRKAVPLNVSNSHRPELTSPMHVAAATGQPLLAPAPMQGPGFTLYTPQGHLVSGGPQPYPQMYMPMRVTPQGNMLVPTSVAYTDSPGSGHGGPMYMSQQGPAPVPGGHQNPLQPPPQQHHHPHHHHPNPAPSPGHPQAATPTPNHNQQQIMYPSAAAAAAAAAQHGPHAHNTHGHGQMHAQHLHSQNHVPPPHPHPHSFPTMMFLPPTHTGQMPPGAGGMAGVHGGPQMAQLLSLGGSPAGVFPMPHTIQFISQAPGPGGQPSHMQSLVPHNQ